MSHAEEDVSQLSFGENFRDVEFIANAGVFALLTAVRQRRLDDEAAGRAPDQPRPSEAFERARDFAGRFGGAMQALDVEKQDRVLTLLSELRFAVPKKAGAGGGAGAGAGAGAFMDEDGLGGGGAFGGAEAEEFEERGLHMYEVTALLNLNPASVAAAKALVPSLENIRDEDFEAAITIVRNATLNIDAAPAPAPADGEEM